MVQSDFVDGATSTTGQCESAKIANASNLPCEGHGHLKFTLQNPHSQFNTSLAFIL